MHQLSPSSRRAWLSLTLLTFALGVEAGAPIVPEPERSVPRLARVSTPPRIDGKLDDPIWSEAEPLADFVELSPSEGDAPDFETRVRLLLDDTHLYVGARMEDDNPERIRRQLLRRDLYAVADYIQLDLDGYGDRRSAQRFRVYASGVQLDALYHGDNREDSSWNAVWRSAVHVDEGGWSAELAIPLSQLRYDAARTLRPTSMSPPPGSGHAVEAAGSEPSIPKAAQPRSRWGLQLSRYVSRTDEFSAWKRISLNQGAWVSRFGSVEPPRLAQAPSLEVVPYAAAIGTLREADAIDPFHEATAFRGALGADLRYRFGSSWALNATVNPDFGQVEADPAQVNLGDTQLFFPERRPFFLEALDLFTGSISQGARGQPLQPFYSRRIGASPSGHPDAPPGAAYVDRPVETPIYGALKLSGRSAGGLSVGVLDAVTAPLFERYADPSGALLPEKQLAQPLSHYVVARAKQELDERGSTVGAWATMVNRRLREGLSDQLIRNAYVSGADFELRFADDRTYLSGMALGSHVEGDPTTVTSRQTGFARYYQRPDAAHLSVDPEARSLTGAASELRFGRMGGENLNWELRAGFTTPGFEINDVGFQNRADDISLAGWAEWHDNEPGPLLQRWNLGINASARTNFGLEPLSPFSSTYFNATTVGFIPFGASFITELPGLDDRLLRGGPLAYQPLDVGLNLWAQTDYRQPVRLNVWGLIGGSVTGREDWSAGFNVNVEPAPFLKLSLSPSFYMMRNDAQFVDSWDDPAATDTHGRQYLLSRLDNVVTSLTGRMDWTFSPTLSLQTYARAAVISGDYFGYGLFTEPRTRQLMALAASGGAPLEATDGFLDIRPPGSSLTYSLEDPDFLFSSLQANVVLRWEYLPGSALYLVYQLDCQGSTSGEGAFDLSAYGDLCQGGVPTSTALAKLTYWWG